MNQNEKSDTFQTKILPESDFSEPDFTDIEAELSQMAEETPDMPETFHSAWTAAVRAEAQANTKTRKKTESRRQWRYILSAAAVFVFLIGGTAVTRMARSNERKAQKASQAPAVMMAIQEDREENSAAGWTVATEDAEMEEAAEEPMGAYAVESSANRIEWDEEVSADSGMAVSGEDAGGLIIDAYEEMVPMAEEAAFPMEEAMEEEMEAEEAEENGPAGTAMADEAAKAAGTSEPTAMPTSPATEEPMPEEKPADRAADESPQENEEAEAEEGFAGFMKDLGAFTLKSLPWLAGAAALIAAAVLICRKAGRKK